MVPKLVNVSFIIAVLVLFALKEVHCVHNWDVRTGGGREGGRDELNKLKMNNNTHE